MAVTLTIDGKEIKAEKGEKVLWVALDNGSYIPNLCAIREAKTPFAACRLCFVEIEGYPEPVTACTVEVAEGMVVHTNTPGVKKLRRSAFELIMSSHPVDCRICLKKGNCELQKIAAFLKVSLKSKRLRKIVKGLPIDDSNPYFIYDPNKCVLCGRCVWVCHEKHGLGAIDFTRRGFDTIVAPFGGETLAESKCDSCCQCVAVCPTGALVLK